MWKTADFVKRVERGLRLGLLEPPSAQKRTIMWAGGALGGHGELSVGMGTRGVYWFGCNNHIQLQK